MKALVVVDMQNDFVTGALKNDDALKIIPNVKRKIENEIKNGAHIFFTRDTHDENYLNTEEGKNLPITHCVKDTRGWQIIDELALYTNGDLYKDVHIIDKYTFGSLDLVKNINDYNNIVKDAFKIYEVELIGICTDICVISNAVLIKAAPTMINASISVDASCCAGVTKESHDTAIEAMKSMHIYINNEKMEPWR